jgi:hypothetical protein
MVIDLSYAIQGDKTIMHQLMCDSSSLLHVSHDRSSAFGLALLGAIAGGFLVARTVGAKCWNLLSVARGSNKGERWCQQGSRVRWQKLC